MKKHLLFGFALAVSVSAFSQNAKQVKPSGITDRLAKKDLVADPEQNGALKNTTGIARPKFNGAAKTAATAATSCTKFSGSANAFGIYQDGHEALQYNADLNAISFVHRCSPTYSSVPNGNTGVVVAKYSTNQGVSWDSTVIWANTTNLARYPQGGLYNPPGNTIFTNAYVVGMGETTTGAGFNGNWLASKQITVPGNTTAGPDQQFFANTAPFGGFKKFDFARYGFTYTKDGFVRGLGQICNDINNTTNLGRGNRGAAVIKGTFNAGSFVWSYDSLIPPTINRPDGSKYLTVYNNLMAWNDAGTVGYVVLTGVRAGSTGGAKGYQPLVYKTTNSGASWSLMPANDFGDPVLFKGVYDRLLSVSSNTALVVPFFSTNEGMDAAVDINDNLHIATTLVGHYSNHNDSLDYTYQFGTENYSNPYGSAFGFPTIYDFYTTSSAGWNYHIVDSMGTEGPGGTSGQPGFSSNPWGPSGVFLDARVQMAVSPDRKKMFYSWTESDSVTVGLKWNIYPDIKMKGFDVTLNKVTPRVNVTGGVISMPESADQQAYMFLMSNRAIVTNVVNNVNEIPFSISYNNTNDGNAPVTHFYLKGASLEQSDFVLNPLSPTGINTMAANTEINTVGNYPNPATDFTTISITLEKAQDFDVTLYNTIGQAIKTIHVNGKNGSNNVHLDLSNLNAGVYMYSVSTTEASVTKKLVVQ